MRPEYPHVFTRRLLSTSVIAAHPASVEGAPNGTPVSASMASPMLASLPGAGETSMPV